MRDNRSQENNITLSFLATYQSAIHDKARELGCIKSGVIFIPELIPYGQKLIDSDLHYDELLYSYPKANQFYHVMVLRALMYGIMLGNCWHNAFDDLDELYETVEEEGPNGLVEDLIEDELSKELGKEQFTLLARWTFTVLVQQLPDEDDPRQYLVQAFNAAYQLGVSVVLSHYGF